MHFVETERDYKLKGTKILPRCQHKNTVVNFFPASAFCLVFLILNGDIVRQMVDVGVYCVRLDPTIGS